MVSGAVALTPTPLPHAGEGRDVLPMCLLFSPKWECMLFPFSREREKVPAGRMRVSGGVALTPAFEPYAGEGDGSSLANARLKSQGRVLQKIDAPISMSASA
jgi:hypothetical protein